MPNAISSRIASLTSRLNPFFLVPAYSAAIVSFLTIRYINLPFNDLSGLVKDGTFKTGYQNETLLKLFFDVRNPRQFFPGSELEALLTTFFYDTEEDR